MDNIKAGLTLVYTGEGKGKTTAALGLALRANGQGLRVGIFQFIKSKERVYGEQIALEKLGVEIVQLGIGFTFMKTPEEHRESLKKAWAYVLERVNSNKYDLIILDELNNALAIDRFPVEDVLPLTEVVDMIKNRPVNLHLVITGRNAKQEIIEAADLVSEVKIIKHHYDRGIPAVEGIEF